MNYPLVTEYIDSIMLSEDNFATLTNLRPVFDGSNNPLYKIEGSSIIFKMKDITTDTFFSVKCFLAEQLGRKEWYNEIIQSNLFFSEKSHFLEKELYVDSDVASDAEFPIFIYPWVESLCLIDYIQVHKKDKQMLAQLAYEFGQIMKWSRDHHFFWDKLDVTKITVSENGYLGFVGIDDILIKGVNDTDIIQSDEVSIVMLLLSLKAIGLDSDLFNYNEVNSHLLFALLDGEHIVQNTIIQKLMRMDEKEVNSLIGYLLVCLNFGCSTGINSSIFSLKPAFESELAELHYYAERGDDKKQVELARIYYSQKSYKEAFRWYEAAARKGNPDGINGVGCCYKRGCPVEKNDKKAAKLFAIAADKGSERALYNLAMAYYNGKGIELDWEKAFSIFKKLAERGDPNSQYMVGKYLMSNHGGTISWHIVSRRNTKEAFIWFEKSAIQGHSGAQQQIGVFYESGTDPCIRNIEKAYEWYKKSAEQGNVEAIYALGRLYANGLDEQNPDAKKAYHYFHQAAELEHPEAQYRVGVALYYGKGVEIDKASAKSWIEKSANQNNESAKNLLRQLESEIGTNSFDNTEATSEEIANARMDSFGVLYNANGTKLLRYAIDDAADEFGFKTLKQQSLKNYIIPEGVEIICDEAFYGCESLEKIELPSSIKLIGEMAFSECENLETIVIPDGVKAIERSTFEGCLSLRNLVLPESLVRITPGSLTGVKGIQSLSPEFVVRDGCLFSSDFKTLIYYIDNTRIIYEIPYGTQHIGECAFENSNLNFIAIPYTVMTIGEGAFAYCKNLERVNTNKIDLPSSIIEIGCGAFQGCTSIYYVKLPDKLKRVDVQTFDGCRNLTYVQIPDNVEEICSWAFAGTNITTVCLPSSLKYIGGMAFSGAPLSVIENNSTNFKVDNLTIYSADYKELIQYYGNDERFIVPKSVSKISDFAFAFAYSINEIVIPDSVKEVGKSFLLETSPDKIIIPHSLKEQVMGKIVSWAQKNVIVNEQ